MTTVIGLTGGIACGKTTASNFFAEQGIEIIDADIAAREVVAPGEPALTEIATRFGDEVLQPDGSLDRKKMRELVFADADKRKQLEAILHPRIRQRLRKQLQQAKGPYVIFSVPLMFESGLDQLTDRVLVIDVSPEVQRQRLIERDGSSVEQANAIVSAQMPREERNSRADDIVDNSTNLDDFISQLTSIHAVYLQLANRVDNP
ncbi:MAG TPA: dephospho-CoA kinase [Gammaproteobacteria bacterium]|nr:dephospho-CoA kinase [Gammaproteobacteria bacterium]